MARIENNIEEIIKGMTYFEKKQLPYMQMLTANNIAFDALDSVKAEIRGKLNIKKQAVPSSFRIKKATKARPYAELFVDEFSWQYRALIHHFKGGNRERKGLEKAMIHQGFMYKHEILTPPPGVTIRPQVYVQIMSQIKLNFKAGYNANETKQSRKRKGANKTNARFFVITGKSKSPLAPGIYARMPGHDKPVCLLRIAEKPEYKKQFDLNDVLVKVITRRGNDHFSKAYNLAMWTSK